MIIDEDVLSNTVVESFLELPTHNPVSRRMLSHVFVEAYHCLQ